MKKKLIIGSAFLFMSIRALSQSPPWLWEHQIGSTGSDVGMSVDFDASGNIYCLGKFSGTVDFDFGPGVFNMTAGVNNNIFVAKYTETGGFVWATSFGAKDPWDISIDMFNNILVVGEFAGTNDFDPDTSTFNMTASGAGDAFILKLDGSGNFKWVKQISSAGEDQAYSVETDPDGNVYTNGFFAGVADFDFGPDTFYMTPPGGYYQVYILKVDSSGNFLWAGSIGSNLEEIYPRMTLELSGGGSIYLSGDFKGTGDFDPGPNAFNLVSAGAEDIFVCKIDSSGNLLWAKAIGSTGSDIPWSITSDNSGNIYSAGFIYGQVDFDPDTAVFYLDSLFTQAYVFKWDSSGHLIWARGMDAPRIVSIAVDFLRRIYITGYFIGVNDFDPGPTVFNLPFAGGVSDVFVARLDSSGNFDWAKSAGGGELERPWNIIVDASGRSIFTGYFYSDQFVFDNDTIVCSGSSSDAFLARLDSGFSINHLEAKESQSVSVFPNPASNQVTVTGLTVHDVSDIRVLDIYGKEQFCRINIQEAGIMIDITFLRQGVYFINLHECLGKLMKIKLIKI